VEVKRAEKEEKTGAARMGGEAKPTADLGQTARRGELRAARPRTSGAARSWRRSKERVAGGMGRAGRAGVGRGGAATLAAAPLTRAPPSRRWERTGVAGTAGSREKKIRWAPQL